MFDLLRGNGRPPMKLMVAAMSSNGGLIGFTISEIVRFLDFRIFA